MCWLSEIIGCARKRRYPYVKMPTNLLASCIFCGVTWGLSAVHVLAGKMARKSAVEIIWDWQVTLHEFGCSFSCVLHAILLSFSRWVDWIFFGKFTCIFYSFFYLLIRMFFNEACCRECLLSTCGFAGLHHIILLELHGEIRLHSMRSSANGHMLIYLIPHVFFAAVFTGKFTS